MFLLLVAAFTIQSTPLSAADARAISTVALQERIAGFGSQNGQIMKGRPVIVDSAATRKVFERIGIRGFDGVVSLEGRQVVHSAANAVKCDTVPKWGRSCHIEGNAILAAIQSIEPTDSVGRYKVAVVVRSTFKISDGSAVASRGAELFFRRVKGEWVIVGYGKGWIS
jgi:hypothetical protein